MLAQRIFGAHGWLAAAAVAAAGCGEELGPERFETTRVVGVVREGRSPVRGGWIEFVPTGGTVGKLRSAPIGPDGRFDADGVAVGKIGIGLTGAPIQMNGGRRYFDGLSAPIERTIPKGARTELTIDLFEEVARGRHSARSRSQAP